MAWKPHERNGKCSNSMCNTMLIYNVMHTSTIPYISWCAWLCVYYNTGIWCIARLGLGWDDGITWKLQLIIFAWSIYLGIPHTNTINLFTLHTIPFFLSSFLSLTPCYVRSVLDANAYKGRFLYHRVCGERWLGKWLRWIVSKGKWECQSGNLISCPR